MANNRLALLMAASTICAVAFGYFLASLSAPSATVKEDLYTTEFSDLATRQLEVLEAIATLRNTATTNVPDGLTSTQTSVAAVRRAVIREVNASEVSGEAQDAFRRNNMLTMDEALDRFGRPDEINRGEDRVHWGYEELEDNGRGGERSAWGLDLQFKDGLLVSVGGSFYDD